VGIRSPRAFYFPKSEKIRKFPLRSPFSRIIWNRGINNHPHFIKMKEKSELIVSLSELKKLIEFAKNEKRGKNACIFIELLENDSSPGLFAAGKMKGAQGEANLF
jgi:hypothetical protein